jgi:glycosyltransferase involved in cell wall biosynthesis
MDLPANPLPRHAEPEIATGPLLQPFLDQSVSIRSIVAFGFEGPFGNAGDVFPASLRAMAGKGTAMLRPVAEINGPAVGTWEASPLSAYNPDTEHAPTLDGLAMAARRVTDAISGTDLLLLPAGRLLEMMTPLANRFAFRAVAAFWPQTPGDRGDDDAWKLQRSLFDRGLVRIASVPLAHGTAHCFLASDAIQSVGRIESTSRGRITLSTLGQNGRFANQLFQYSWAKLYALRHGLSAAFPDWDGRQLFGLDDPTCAGPALERLSFAGFTDDDRRLWEREDPPIDVDLWGYFQETPACWQHHRPLLRRLFQLPVEQVRGIDSWRDRVTNNGQRTLVAIHLRRGDYRKSQFDVPYFRLVPEQWYLDWLRALWPTLRSPVLFIATDEPETIRPAFSEFETVSETFGPPADALPDHVRDFEILRRADHLAICNSSYSRMAAILALPAQKSYVPSFRTQSFSAYEPWIDPAFWERFSESPREPPLPFKDHRSAVAVIAGTNASEGTDQTASIFFDVSDLVLYLINHATLSGIQRVQCEILRNLAAIPHRRSVRLVVLKDGDDLRAIETEALLPLLEEIGSGGSARAIIVSGLRALLGRAVRCTVQPHDIFLVVGAFWPVRGMGRLLRQLKNADVIVGALIHDLLPIDTPEYFEARATKVFAKGVFEVLTFADFIVTTSEYNKDSVTRLMAAGGYNHLPVHVVPLAREQAHGAFRGAEVSPSVQRILETDYVLCVGTIEVRKNPGYLFHIWKLMLQSGRQNIPHLVFAGRIGWLVRDFMDQLAACDYLGGRIVMVHNATDFELDLLYRNCLLTMFPSFAEGWGLPVGESLAHGKVCLCAATGGIPDVAGAAGDYIDPHNTRDGLRQLTRYLDDPQLRRTREREIVDQFMPRSWRSVADDFLRSTLDLARDVQPVDGVAVIRLPPARYLPISSDGAAMPFEGIDGALSAELICASGWHPADISGARADGRAATVQFRAAAPVGAGIALVMRLAASGRPFSIRLRSGSGAEIETRLAPGTERVAVLSCQVEAGNLVTVDLSSDAASAKASRWGRARHWTLKGILYFEPRRLTPAAMQQMLRGEQYKSPSVVESPPTARRPGQAEHGLHRKRILLSSAVSMDDRRRAPSLHDFLHSTNCWWPSDSTTRLHAPLFANDADRRAFVAGCANGPHATLAARDGIKLTRRSDVFVSMARLSEGSIFDRSGVWRAMGYLQGMPRDQAPWLSNEPGGVRIDADALAAAPYVDASCLVFYNGNLHNYYHWLAEGLLCLDVLAQTTGPDPNLRIALPRSMDINAVFDHRRTLDEVGLGGSHVVEVAEDLIRVREAIWVDSDLVQSMPAQYLVAFQQRIAARYAHLRGPRKRRLLIARRGPTRMIANLADVEALLSGYGFETVYLEGMSMAEQILLFQGAEFIVGTHGAGLANLLFCEPGTRVIEFMPTAEFRPFFWLISEKLELAHGVLFCPATEGHGFQGALDVDVGKLQALIGVVDAAAAASTASATARRTA